jgi:hypothetical protein
LIPRAVNTWCRTWWYTLNKLWLNISYLDVWLPDEMYGHLFLRNSKLMLDNHVHAKLWITPFCSKHVKTHDRWFSTSFLFGAEKSRWIYANYTPMGVKNSTTRVPHTVLSCINPTTILLCAWLGQHWINRHDINSEINRLDESCKWDLAACACFPLLTMHNGRMRISFTFSTDANIFYMQT